MSLLENLFSGILKGENSDETIVRPCSNCPSKCTLAPDACSVCRPYKERMADAIYNVEHMDEIISKYEVTGTTDASGGTIKCPHCGGNSADPFTCEYCGSVLQEGNSKIKVASAADIPNPILDAQDIIFERFEAVKSAAREEPEGLLGSIFGVLFGDNEAEEAIRMGAKMTEDEIREMADYYHVSVADYLTGLDNGKYVSYINKDAERQLSESSKGSFSSSPISGLGGMAGLAGIMGLGSLLTGNTASARINNNYNNRVGMNRMQGMDRMQQGMVRPQGNNIRPQGMQHQQGNGHIQQGGSRQQQGMQRPQGSARPQQGMQR
ncbi:MAG: hypothetical protein HUJ76_12845, partial [Parasporobacterium sp.]|nr:hypothetical protein [Parasporobacterium sp.]